MYDSMTVLERKRLGTCIVERLQIHKRADANATKTTHDEEEQASRESVQFLAD